MSESMESVQLDTELLNGYIQSLGQKVIQQMYALYGQQVIIYLKDIEDSLLCGDEKLWQEHCHKMKGAAGSVGLKALHSRLKLMEKTTIKMSDRSHQLAELKLHNKKAMGDFRDWLENL